MSPFQEGLQLFWRNKVVQCHIKEMCTVSAVFPLFCPSNVYICSKREKVGKANSVSFQNNMGLKHHICEDNSYNGVKLCESLLEGKTRVFDTIRTNKWNSSRSWESSKNRDERVICFCRKGDILFNLEKLAGGILDYYSSWVHTGERWGNRR
jgi:hypothetical protein